MPETTPSFSARLSLALRLLFDAGFAAKVSGAATQAPKVLPEPPRSPAKSAAEQRDVTPALQLLELLQREGRFVDFVRQDIVAFADSEVGAAARIVHQGCRRALEQSCKLDRIRPESEGAHIVLDAGFDNKACRLVGNVQGLPPYHGTLKHPGWRVTQLTLEEPLAGADLHVLAQAEVEL